jgi:hypothetical protein
MPTSRRSVGIPAAFVGRGTLKDVPVQSCVIIMVADVMALSSTFFASVGCLGHKAFLQLLDHLLQLIVVQVVIPPFLNQLRVKLLSKPHSFQSTGACSEVCVQVFGAIDPGALFKTGNVKLSTSL